MIEEGERKVLVKVSRNVQRTRKKKDARIIWSLLLLPLATLSYGFLIGASMIDWDKFIKVS